MYLADFLLNELFSMSSVMLSFSFKFLAGCGLSYSATPSSYSTVLAQNQHFIPSYWDESNQPREFGDNHNFSRTITLRESGVCLDTTLMRGEALLWLVT